MLSEAPCATSSSMTVSYPRAAAVCSAVVAVGIRGVDIDPERDRQPDRLQRDRFLRHPVRIATATDRRRFGDSRKPFDGDEWRSAAHAHGGHQCRRGALVDQGVRSDAQGPSVISGMVNEPWIGALLSQTMHDRWLAEAGRQPERGRSDVGWMEREIDTVAPRRCRCRERGVRIGTMQEQRAHQAFVVAENRRVQCGIPRTRRVRIGALLEQKRGQLAMPAMRGHHAGTGAVGRRVVDVGAGRHEALCRDEIAHPRRKDQRGVPPASDLNDVVGMIPGFRCGLDHLGPGGGPRVQVGPMLEQHRHDIGVLLRDRPHQGGLSPPTLRRIDVGPRHEELLDDTRGTATRRCHQGVSPERSVALALAPDCKSRSTMAALAFSQAIQSGVTRRSFTAVTSAPWRIRTLTVSASSR